MYLKPPVAEMDVGSAGAVVSPPPVNVAVTNGPLLPDTVTARTRIKYSTPSTRGVSSILVSDVIVAAKLLSALALCSTS